MAVTLIRASTLSDVAEFAYAATATATVPATAPADARLNVLAGYCPLEQDGSTHTPALTPHPPQPHRASSSAVSLPRPVLRTATQISAGPGAAGVGCSASSSAVSLPHSVLAPTT